MQIYRAIKYIRLSYTDDKTVESNSVANQRKLIDDFIAKHDDIEVVAEKVDDGYSGVLYDRPAFTEMMELIKQGKANCVIVKDLSRLGREYIETGRYLRRVFPAYGVRFIAINDNFDTLNEKADELSVSIKNIMNEEYSRDISVKTRSALDIKRRNGDFVGAFTVYGYLKTGESHKSLVIDPFAANVVRDIFRKRLERYTGMYVMGKKHSAEVGSYKMIRNDESEWIKIPDHHTPIISKELFEQAKAKIRKFSVDKKPREYLMKGKVFCGCCDHAMNRQNDRWYICRYGEIGTDKGCQSARISVKDLERTVFDTIRSQAQSFIDTDADIKIRAEKSALELNGYEQKLKLLQESKRELYEQYILGILDIDTYKSKKAELEIQLADMKHLCSVVADKAKTAQEDYEESIKNAEIAASIDGADSLTKALVDQLVERVYVFPNNRIEIKYATRRIF